MINEIITAILHKLKELYPECKQHIDNIPPDFMAPAFVICITGQDYTKCLNNRYKARISFDLAYYSDKAEQEIRSDCLSVQETLLRYFDTIGPFKAVNKNARITDNVLHMTFDVNYSEMRIETSALMQSQKINQLFKKG